MRHTHRVRTARILVGQQNGERAVSADYRLHSDELVARRIG